MWAPYNTTESKVQLCSNVRPLFESKVQRKFKTLESRSRSYNSGLRTQVDFGLECFYKTATLDHRRHCLEGV